MFLQLYVLCTVVLDGVARGLGGCLLGPGPRRAVLAAGTGCAWVRFVAGPCCPSWLLGLRWAGLVRGGPPLFWQARACFAWWWFGSGIEAPMAMWEYVRGARAKGLVVKAKYSPGVLVRARSIDFLHVFEPW